MRTTPQRVAAMAGILAAALALAACSTATTPAPTEDLAIGAIDLSGVCPETITVQTDWNPESEHGHLYQLFGPDPVIDAGSKSVSGPLYASGEYTGVDIEVRAGGPAIGFQTVSSQMYADTDITLGYVATDEAMQLSATQPTVAVFAPLEKSPLMIMWDPGTYPDVSTIAELAETGAIIKYFGGSAYMEYFKGAGIIAEAQADGSYDGTPANFVASQGADAQQGYASAEPYIYENEIEQWGEEVDFQLINDAGYPYYQSAISVRTDDLETLAPCLELLVPVLQQGSVDFSADPSAAVALILELVEAYDTGWVYSQGVADFSTASMAELGLVSNGDNDTIGDFDEARVASLIEIDTPIFEGEQTPPLEGLTPADLFTNEFLDPSIGLK
jgi:hypothetical protein